jgi:hypothetical protein
MTRSQTLGLIALVSLPLLAACGTPGEATARWSGTMDTLPSGQIRIHNTDTPILPPTDAWRVVEEVRIGTMEGDGPDLLGEVRWLEADPAGRIWVLEGQALEIRVFEPDGSYVRTIGREGGGPGEFSYPLHIQLGPDGNMWVTDPQNNRISVFDTSGTYLDGKRMPGGFVIMPWPGGFDAAGYHYGPVPLPSDDEGFNLGLVKYDATFEPLDTLAVPSDPVEREYFEIRREDSFWRQGIPYTGGFDWRLAPSGAVWGMFTDEYRLFELSAAGDTVRTIFRDFTPLPVTEADMERAREQMESFIRNGGKVDWSKIPSSKPATEEMYVDDEGNVWVRLVTAFDDRGRAFDVFDPEGRFLCTVRTAFSIARFPPPIFRNGYVFAVVEDDLEIPYVVRARIERPDWQSAVQ